MTIIQLTGQEALKTAQAANMLPEIFGGLSWSCAHGIPEATRLIHTEPQCVRLRASGRVLVENVLKRSMPVDANLTAVVHAALSDVDIPPRTRDVLTIILEAL